eukprot:6463992-Amphidinium_carterae.1
MKRPTVLRIGVDSGAAAFVVPTGATNAPTERDALTGRCYQTATKEVVQDQGQQVVAGKVAGVDFSAKLRVCGVYKALMSVGEMVDQNYRVVFDRDVSGRDMSHALHKPSGTKVPFQRNGKTFDIVMELPSNQCD